MSALAGFTPKHRFLAAIDSDGCAIDSMEVKHRECFGPTAVTEWGLWTMEAAFLARWNDINLYTQTRGANRFKTLAQILAEFNVTGHDEVCAWVSRAKSLSNDSLACETSDVLKKVLRWSQDVNKAIEALPMPVTFAGVGDALKLIGQSADIAVVSSANRSAIEKEWDAGGILHHAAIVLSQSDGTKNALLGGLIEKGYDPKRVVMIGDSPGDLDAAVENNTCFYPIIPKREFECWRVLTDVAWGDFLAGKLKDYTGEFNQYLGGKCIKNRLIAK